MSGLAENVVDRVGAGEGCRPAAERAPCAASGRPGGKGWVVSPAFDLLFLANLGWLVLLIPGLTQSGVSIDFWTVYYLSLPHRWITLILVAADPDRREGRGLLLGAIAAGAALLVVGVYCGTGAFLCLAMVDYLWNAWHFGSQHGGVLRMYSRMVGGGSVRLERWGVRALVVYAALRTVGWATGDLSTSPDALSWLETADLAILLIPAALILSNLVGAGRDRVGKLAYVGSVCLLYSGIVLSVRAGWSGVTLALIAAAPLFHAVEYLAIVTHYAWRRETVGSAGRFRVLARHWLTYLGLYVLLLGSAGAWMARPEGGLVVLWQGLNLWASFVHYAFDGMIWKLRRPATAAALGVGAA